MREQFRLENIPPDNREIGRLRPGLRFFNQTVHGNHFIFRITRFHNSVFMGFFRSYFLNRDNVTADDVIDIHHLLQASGRALHQNIRQQNRKRFIAHQFCRTPHRMTKAQRARLARHEKAACGHFRIPHFFKHICFATRFECLLQLRLEIEMLLEHFFIPSGDENEFFDACFARFLDNILDEGTVIDRQHLLRHDFGCRKKTCAQTRNRKNSFTDGAEFLVFCHIINSLYSPQPCLPFFVLRCKK